ncbi:CRAL/TRIO domain-containing protein [Stemphylium lycopersici]|nr:cral trio domain-containing protein [Stemphylium lycopersici]RAR05135.1 CRAL/TRIO domain-containing protein [Stemphylium lycopersici]
MSAKPEEANAAPTEGAGLLGGAGLEKQPEPNLTAESTDKDETEAVDNATAAVADLSVGDKKEEEQKTEEAPPSPTYATAPAVAPTAAASDPKPEATTTTEPTQGPVWPETAPDHPLTKFYDSFEALVADAQHNEVYGIELSKSNPFHTKLILQKFLRANQNDLEKAKTQLLETLKWRKTFDPIKAASVTYEKSKFDGLGYVLEVAGVPESPNKTDIVTFNIYGAVKDNKATFGDLDA